MYGYIDGIDFHNLDAEKYWTFAKSYKGNSKEETEYMIKSGNYIGSLKKDGHYARFIKDEDGNMMLQGRSKSVSGEYLNKIEWVPQCQEFFDKLPNGTCLLGELYFPNKGGSRNVTTILGCLKPKALERQEKGEKLCYYVFDVWAYDGKSYLNTIVEDRVNKVSELKGNYSNIVFAEYFDGEILWDKLGEYLSRGEEGIVITKKGTVPSPGKKPARKTLKVKQEISKTIDAFLDGDYKPATKDYEGKKIEAWNYWINNRTGEKSNECKFFNYTNGEPWEPVTKAYFYGWASAVSLSVMKDGTPVRIAWISGITDELKKGIVEQPEKWKNKVVELSGMKVEQSSEMECGYSLRHGKIVCFRDDKPFEDCDFDQIISN